MKQKSVNNKYQFYPEYNRPDIDYSELVTVPDQVLSMYDIYMKYAVRGDIAGLANNIRPHVSDDLDLDDPELDVEYDDDLDVLQRASQVRTYSSASVAADSQPPHDAADDSRNGNDSASDNSHADSDPTKNKPASNPASDNAGSAGSE